MSTSLHNILVGGAILIVVVVGTVISFSSLLSMVFGRSGYARLVKEMGAVKSGPDQYDVTIDGERVTFGDNASSYRIKSSRNYFFVAIAFTHSGYLGLYDRRSEMYGAKCHPDTRECHSGDAEFDKLFLMQAENAAFANALLASPSTRETLRRLRDAGFAEIQFNDERIYPARKQYVSARISYSGGSDAFSRDDVTPTLIRRAAKMLRELASV